MKFQNKIVKRLVSILLCGSICVVAAVAVSYSPWTSTVTGMSNIKYHGRTSITASKGMVSSTATILTTDSTKVPAGYVKASAELYRGIALSMTTMRTRKMTCSLVWRMKSPCPRSRTRPPPCPAWALRAKSILPCPVSLNPWRQR